MSGKRNYGVDLLRILLMLLIIIGHLYAHTEIRSQLPLLSGKWVFTWTTQTITVCAVDCFVIITGYYMFFGKYDLFRLVRLWAKVIFYSLFITITLICLNLMPISTDSVLGAIFPVLRNEYWFFTMYILLYILIPFLNIGLNKMSKKIHGTLVVIILAFFYIEPLFSVVFYEYDTTEGFSIVAFVTLYVVGAYLARCRTISKKKCVCLLLASSLVMFLSKVVFEQVNYLYDLNYGTGLLYHNNCIFVLVNAIALFELFKQIDVGEKLKHIIAWINPSVFSVYLLHEKPAIRELIWGDYLLDSLKESSLIGYCLLIIGIGVGILIAGIVLDKFFTWTVFKFVEKSSVVERVKIITRKYNEEIIKL